MPKRKGKKRKKKDPQKPKRAMSSFMFFANELRPKLRLERPNLKITDLGKELGKMWKALPDTDKKRYQEEADKDKSRYKEAMKGYIPLPESNSDDEGPIRKRRKKKKKKIKDPFKPKRAMSSFMFFLQAKRQEVRDKFPDLKITDIGKRLSELWKEIPPEERQKYVDQAERDKERYKAQMEKYKQTKVVPIKEGIEAGVASVVATTLDPSGAPIGTQMVTDNVTMEEHSESESEEEGHQSAIGTTFKEEVTESTIGTTFKEEGAESAMGAEGSPGGEAASPGGEGTLGSESLGPESSLGGEGTLGPESLGSEGSIGEEK